MRWLPGTVLEKLGAVMYKILVNDRGLRKRHADQIVTHLSPTCSPNSSTPDDVESFTDRTTSTEGENPTQTDEPLPSVMTPEVPEQTSVEESGETGN